MKTLTCLLALLTSPLFAQNFVGTWQGTLQPPQGKAVRLVLKISRAGDESLSALVQNADQGGQAISASAITQRGAALKVSIAAVGGGYEGKLSEDGDSITGTWSQANVSLPLMLARATPSTAWVIPEAPPPPRQMASDANPVFEVATIKPSRPEAQGSSILVGQAGTNVFTTVNTTLNDLIVFAYGLHARQVTGGPVWAASERYDLMAKPDEPGIPNMIQLRSMLQKLLVERYQLTFHYEKKEISAYAIKVAKGGAKLSPSSANAGSLPGFGGRVAGTVGVRNASMPDFAGFLQSRVLERPVVDQTELMGRFDFQLRWTPDGAAAGTNPDAPPDLFVAIQQQLGLKLESTKAPVEVMVIDRADKPSEN